MRRWLRRRGRSSRGGFLAPRTCSKAREPGSYSRSPHPRQRRVGQADNDECAPGHAHRTMNGQEFIVATSHSVPSWCVGRRSYPPSVVYPYRNRKRPAFAGLFGGSGGGVWTKSPDPRRLVTQSSSRRSAGIVERRTVAANPAVRERERHVVDEQLVRDELFPGRLVSGDDARHRLVAVVAVADADADTVADA